MRLLKCKSLLQLRDLLDSRAIGQQILLLQQAQTKKMGGYLFSPPAARKNTIAAATATGILQLKFSNASTPQ